MGEREERLVTLGQSLKDAGYNFTTVTPETHRRVVARQRGPERSLRDVFGWNLPFAADALPAPVLQRMREADVIRAEGAALCSTVRFSTLGDDLFMHSPFPTNDKAAIFFGPDTYRFARLLRERAPSARHAVDMGCGSGAGGLSIRDRIEHLTLTDISAQAMRFAAVNCALAGAHSVELRQSDCLASVHEPCDLIVANPPYVVDTRGRTYRDGGGSHGVALAKRMTEEALRKLAPGGTLIMYTGTPVCQGRNMFWEAVTDAVRAQASDIDYGEIDPDVFGEELDTPAYANAERLCVVQLVARKRT